MSYEQLATSVDDLAEANRGLTSQIISTQEAVELAATEAEQSATASAASAELSKQYAEEAAELSGMQNPMTAPSDIIIGGTGGSPVRLPVGSNGQVLISQGSGVTWGTLPKTYVYLPLVTRTAAFTLSLADAGKYLTVGSSSVLNITVPPQTAIDWEAETEITIEQSGTGVITVVPGAGVTLNRLSTNTLSSAGQFAVITLKRTALNTWTVFGALGV